MHVTLPMIKKYHHIVKLIIPQPESMSAMMRLNFSINICTKKINKDRCIYHSLYSISTYYLGIYYIHIKSISNDPRIILLL